MASSLALLRDASDKLQWLAARQAVVGQNIANVDTPAYQARDLKPLRFRDVLAETRGSDGPRDVARGIARGLARTHTGHLDARGPARGPYRSTRTPDFLEETLSGNNVNLQENLVKLASIEAEYGLATNLMSRYHSMILQATRAR